MPTSQLDSHVVYLEHLKQWLKANKFPKDYQKLADTLKLLMKLEVVMDESERVKLRALMSDTFGLTAEEMLGFLPSADVQQMYQEQATRGKMPELPGVVGAYVRLMVEHESPDSFHAMALMTSLGAALGRRVWVDRTWFKVWPNLSMVLTGPAGGPRKSSACDLGLATIRGTFRGWKPKLIMDASPQAILADMDGHGEDAVGFIYAPEFRHFFPSAQFMEGSVPLITRLLDNPDHYSVSRITRKGEVLKNVTLSLKGGSTLDWLAKMPSDAQGGGFWTRVIIVYEEASKKVEELQDAERRELQAAVRDGLEQADAYGHGPVRLTKEGTEWFDEWYQKLKDKKIGHPRLILYYNRKHVHLLRTAMLMWLPKRILGARELEITASFLDWLERPLPDVYRLIGMSKSGEMTRAVLDALKMAGGRMAYSDLMRELKGLLNKRDFKQAVDTLKEAGQVKEIETLAEHTLVLREVGLVE